MGTLEQNLFPRLEESWERSLTDKEQQLVSILEVLQIEKFVRRPGQRCGRKPWERQALARAFVGKAVYDHPHTRTTWQALRTTPVFRCESTFSRAFAEFAAMGLGERVHAALVATYVKPELVRHISGMPRLFMGGRNPGPRRGA